MGVYFFVIASEFASPVRQVDNTYRRGRYTNTGRFRRLTPSVTSNRRERGDRSGEPVEAVISRICSTIGRASLDALFIFAHGIPNSVVSNEEGYPEPTIKLGRGLTQTTAASFSRIRHLWSREYRAGDYSEGWQRQRGRQEDRPSVTEDENYRGHRIVVPRIELHVCHAGAVWNQPVVRALARAAGVPVFASATLQMVENLSFEGRVLRFNPPSSVA